MGEHFLSLYKRIKREYKIAFWGTFIIAMLIHFYKFTNTLLNHDSLANYYSDQNILGSGRWALAAACGISSYYNLPWITGIFSCVFIALTVVAIVALFHMKNPILIGLTGGLLAASPAVTETFFFQYTADGYMLSMFLSAVAVYFSRMEERRFFRWILAGICLCISCGIYQAYISFALLLAVFYFTDILLDGRCGCWDCFKWILRMVILFGLSLAAYYGIWQICLHMTDTAVNDYQGISQVGKTSVELLGTLIGYGWRRSFHTVNNFFLQGDVLEYGFSLYSVLNLIFFVVMAIGILIAVLKSGISKRLWAVVLLLLCLFAIVPFACIWYFVSSGVGYATRMLQSLVLLYVITAVLYEKWAKTLLKEVVCAILFLVVLNNGIVANICYFYMDLSYERTYAEALEIYLEIHDLQEEYEFDKMAMVGTRSAEDVVFYKTYEGKLQKEGQYHIVSNMVHKTLMFESGLISQFLTNTLGMDVHSLSKEQCEEMKEHPEVQKMPCWPAEGGMTVINDVLVIKFAGEE